MKSLRAQYMALRVSKRLKKTAQYLGKVRGTALDLALYDGSNLTTAQVEQQHMVGLVLQRQKY